MNNFEVSKSYTTLLRVSLTIALGFLILGLSLPLVSDSADDIVLVTLLSTFVWRGASFWAWKVLKKLPSIGISVDEEGIWYRHLGKEAGLICWHQIEQIKERRYMQRLELVDSYQKKLLKVDYQLHGFEVLRDILNERINCSSSD